MNRWFASVLALVLLVSPAVQAATACCPLWMATAAAASETAEPAHASSMSATTSEAVPCHEGGAAMAMTDNDATAEAGHDGTSCAQAFDCCHVAAALAMGPLPLMASTAPPAPVAMDDPGDVIRSPDLFLRPPSIG